MGCFNITLPDDQRQEDDEVFLYSLEIGQEFFSEVAFPVPIEPSVTTITILDDGDPGMGYHDLS